VDTKERRVKEIERRADFVIRAHRFLLSEKNAILPEHRRVESSEADFEFANAKLL